MVFDNKFSEVEASELKSVANRLGVPSDWLSLLIGFETGWSFKHTQENGIGCVGYIQFCPIALKDLGISKAQLLQAGSVGQFRYVEQYLRKAMDRSGNPLNFGEFYLLVFYPRAIQKTDSFVLGSEVSNNYAVKVASQNPSFSKGKMYITKKDVIESKRALALQYNVIYSNVASNPVVYVQESFIRQDDETKSIIILVLIIALLVAISSGWFLFKNWKW